MLHLGQLRLKCLLVRIVLVHLFDIIELSPQLVSDLHNLRIFRQDPLLLISPATRHIASLQARLPTEPLGVFHLRWVPMIV